MSWLRSGLMLAIFATTPAVFAQFNINGSINAGYNANWGAGLWGGQQSCNVATKLPDTFHSITADIEGINDDIQAMQDEIKAAKEDRQRLLGELYPNQRATSTRDCSFTKTPDRINELFDAKNYPEGARKVLLEHLTQGYKCNQYAECAPAPAPTATTRPQEVDEFAGSGGGAGVVSAGSGQVTSHCSALSAAGQASFRNNVCADDGRIKGDIVAKPGKSRSNLSYNKWAMTYNACKDLDARIVELTENIKRAKDDVRRLQGERKRDFERSLTEAQACPTGECGRSRGSMRSGRDWESIGINALIGTMGIYLGRSWDRERMENNTAMGLPSAPSASWSVGFPFIANAMYGALGGNMGQGAFGCASGPWGNGFTNGPAGMMGAFGNNSMFPNTGMCVQGQGCPFNNPFGMPMSMMGNPIGGGAYNMGMNPWGLNGPGIGLQGQLGLNLGGAGNPLGAMFGLQGQMSPFGYPIAGVGGQLGIDPMTGMPIGGQFGMQNPGIMQQNLQQYQAYLDGQRRQLDNYMMQQRAAAGVYSEMQSLMARLQAIQSGTGVNFGGGLGGSLGGGFGGQTTNQFGGSFQFGYPNYNGYNPYGSGGYNPYGTGGYNPYGTGGYNQGGYLGPGSGPTPR